MERMELANNEFANAFLNWSSSRTDQKYDYRERKAGLPNTK